MYVLDTAWDRAFRFHGSILNRTHPCSWCPTWGCRIMVRSLLHVFHQEISRVEFGQVGHLCPLALEKYWILHINTGIIFKKLSNIQNLLQVAKINVGRDEKQWIASRPVYIGVSLASYVLMHENMIMHVVNFVYIKQKPYTFVIICCPRWHHGRCL